MPAATQAFGFVADGPVLRIDDAPAVRFDLLYPGQVYDVETGWHYNHHRYYDPQVGRYITSDPVGLAGGWNRFAYVDSNPLINVDPLGLANPGQPSSISSLESAIARGDIRQIEALMEGLGPNEQVLARQALEKFESQAGDWIGKNCLGKINREFPNQFRDKSLKEILDLSKTGNGDARKAWKLFNDSRFQK